MPLKTDKLVKSFGRTKAVESVNLDVRDGEFFVILGPSGCGKTTLLRCIAGLEWPDSGKIFLNGTDITRDSPSVRDVAFVFQQATFLPNKTVAENIAHPVVCRENSLWRLIRGGLTEQQMGVARKWAERLQISELLARYPQTLSGGQLQRMSLGRALAKGSSLILFDEPLANLDLRLRDALRVELLRLKDEVRVSRRCTMIYVTHEQEDALLLADRLAIMREGRIVQVDSPAEVYRHPVDAFTASFLGSPPINLVLATLRADGFDMRLEFWRSGISAPGGLVALLRTHNPSMKVTIGVRPSAIRLHEEGCFEGHVTRIANLVNYFVLWVNVGDGEVSLVQGSTPEAKPGEVVRFTVDTSELLFFDPASGQRVA